MDSRIEAYIDVISSEPKGEEVRSAIQKAIMVLDDNRVVIDGDSTSRMALRTNVDTALDDMWDDVTYFFPNAVRPEYDDDEQYSNIEGHNNSELRSFLIAFKNAPIGTEIRNAMYLALENVRSNSSAQDLIRYYFTQRMLDMFAAFINACDDTEKRTYANQDRSAWAMTVLNSQRKVLDTTGVSTLTLIRGTKTGSDMRTPLIDIITDINDFNESKQSLTNSYGNDYSLVIKDSSTDFEHIAGRLFESTDVHGRWSLSAGGPYNIKSEAESRALAVNALGDLDFDVYLTYDAGYYVLLTDVPVPELPVSQVPRLNLTHVKTDSECSIENEETPELNLTPFEFHPLYEIQFSHYSSSTGLISAIANSYEVKANTNLRTYINSHSTNNIFDVIVSDAKFDTYDDANEFLVQGGYSEFATIIAEHYSQYWKSPSSKYQICCGAYATQSEASTRASYISSHYSTISGIDPRVLQMGDSWAVLLYGSRFRFDTDVEANQFIHTNGLRFEADVFI